jgi:hypothetical protein
VPRVTLALGVGDGTFAARLSAYPEELGPYVMLTPRLCAGDFAARGREDLVVSDVSGSLTYLRNDGPAGFFAGQQHGIPEDAHWLVAASTTTSRIDLLSPTYCAVQITPTFPDAGLGPGFTVPIGGVATAATAYDINGDGLPDVLATLGDANALAIALQLAEGGFAAPMAFPVTSAPSALAVGDVNQDGKPDVVTANANGDVAVFLGQ